MGLRVLSKFSKLIVLLYLTLQSSEATNIRLIPRYPHISAFGGNPFIHQYHGNAGYISSGIGQYNLNQPTPPVISNPNFKELNAQVYGVSSPDFNINKKKPGLQHIQDPNLKPKPYQLGLNKAGPKQYSNGPKQQQGNNVKPNTYNNGHKQSHSYTIDQNQYNNGHAGHHYNSNNNKNTNYDSNEGYGNGNEYNNNNQYNDGSYQQHGNGHDHHVKENNYQDQDNINPNSGYDEDHSHQYDDSPNHSYDENPDNDEGNHSYENNKGDNEYTVVTTSGVTKEYGNNHYHQNQDDQHSHPNSYPNYSHTYNHGSQGTGNTYNQNPQSYEGNKPNFKKGSSNQHTYDPNQGYVDNNHHNNKNNNYINKYTINPNNGNKKPVYNDSPRPSHQNGNNKKITYNANYGNNNQKYNNPPKSGNEKKYQTNNGQSYAHNGQSYAHNGEGNSNLPPHLGQVSYNDGQGHNAPPYGIQSPYSQNQRKAKTGAHTEVNKNQQIGKLQHHILNNGNGHNILKTNPQYVLNADNGQSLSALNIPPSFNPGYVTPELLNQRIFLHEPLVFI